MGFVGLAPGQVASFVEAAGAVVAAHPEAAAYSGHDIL
jgi:hypothetical protein